MLLIKHIFSKCFPNRVLPTKRNKIGNAIYHICFLCSLSTNASVKIFKTLFQKNSYSILDIIHVYKHCNKQLKKL